MYGGVSMSVGDPVFSSMMSAKLLPYGNCEVEIKVRKLGYPGSNYLWPSQCRGQEIDYRESFHCTLHELF